MGDAARRTMTEAEFLRLPESMSKIELVDGEVVVAPSPTVWHQEIQIRIASALRTWAERRRPPVTVHHSPLDVRFGPNRILQPDVFVLFARIAFDHRGPIDRIPALCVEVLSRDRAHDTITKRRLYADAGVQELWLVDPAGRVERCSGEGLAISKPVRARLTSPLLPGFSLDLRRLFARRR